MKLLFADVDDPIAHCNKELQRHGNFSLNPGRIASRVKRRWYDTFLEQCINAAIVGGIAACATSFESWSTALKAFGITFLVELRKYRKL